ncbi:MAG TPA: hypothetical protein VFU49_14475 [Ktedonobacteraceae bacterium]|nr:hypothetical protein [Ktedonobacteraceae bacterium]
MNDDIREEPCSLLAKEGVHLLQRVQLIERPGPRTKREITISRRASARPPRPPLSTPCPYLIRPPLRFPLHHDFCGGYDIGGEPVGARGGGTIGVGPRACPPRPACSLRNILTCRGDEMMQMNDDIREEPCSLLAKEGVHLHKLVVPTRFYRVQFIERACLSCPERSDKSDALKRVGTTVATGAVFRGGEWVTRESNPEPTEYGREPARYLSARF